MNLRFHQFFVCGLFLSFGMLFGCSQQPEAEQSDETLVVPVSKPVRREVTDYVDYTGRTAALNSVDIRPRVTGYLMKMPFKEGAEVKTNDLLFEIDPRPYQALVDQAQAQVTLNLARYQLAKSNNTRARTVAYREPGSFSQQELDTYQAQEIEADAAVKAAKATLEVYKLNRSFCEVTSPIDGQISRYYYTLGNLVNQDQTTLTTVVSLDPMYCYFDVDERTLLRIRKGINEGAILVPPNTEQVPVYMALEGEANYPHQGTLNFLNNQVNPSTGTLTARGVFPNPKPPSGRRLLTPGMFARIRVRIGQPHQALLVADRAIGSDQGLKFVYVVDQDNKVQYRRVTMGPLESDGLRVIEGVEADERVVVGALPQVRPLMQVEPEDVEMPTIGTGQAPPPVPRRPQPPPAGEKTLPTPKEKK
ncbi:MAG: efflux RND transporter periplasmic adaptor subunit [Gemmataceae bacterium]